MKQKSVFDVHHDSVLNMLLSQESSVLTTKHTSLHLRVLFDLTDVVFHNIIDEPPYRADVDLKTSRGKRWAASVV